MSEAPVLDIQRLTVALPRGAERPNAIEDIRLTVRPREIVCVVGESGSGKSVTAFSIMGLLPNALKPTGGRILLQGEDVLAIGKGRLRELRGSRMAMIFQEPMTALNPVIPVGDQIAEALEWHTTKLSRADKAARVRELMDDVRLPDPATLARAYPHQLSGGQRQRVMIAMALANEPALIIADEPTTALDVTTQAQILKLMRELQARHSSGILFITHDFGVVAEIADRVVVMRAGRVVEEGSTDEILTRPQEAYTRMLINAVPKAIPGPARAITDSAPILVTQDLVKVYGDGLFSRGPKRVIKALDEVTIALRRGETLGIVGESGSGKSTLARCIARFVDPSGGEIRLDGEEIGMKPVRALRPYRRRIQVIFQDPYRSLNPRRTIGKSIVEGPMNYGTGRVEAYERARSLLQLVGLDSASLDRFPHEFSGGQRQRIAIARALAMEPELLIADEAVSALDVSVQGQVLDLLESVREKFGLAILFITHDLRVAARICDSVAVMLNGKVVEIGPSAAIFGDPQHSYTQALFAAAPGQGRFAELPTARVPA
ncbi:ABC transporter ATP-binding protein [uncultured Enterovirga sp.]|uniref:ABC transporter ATP-binding protein n=1 Tax=uncultured Enterovirga sp. TaxID=2026352 RepID=UPI0035CB9A19